MTATVTLRPVEPEDDAFLLALYDAARAAELDLVAWPPGQREAFVRMQLDLQTRQYRAAHPDGDFLVVEVDGVPAGRLTLAHGDADVRVVDIALLPAHRGAGLGRALLADVLDDAAASGRTVSLHVEAHNPARRLYERLGFRLVADEGVYLLLEWRAP
jgi:ribosomal protein S18 acetylase RimI-like enzyme